MQRQIFASSNGAAISFAVAAGLVLMASGASAATSPAYPAPGKPNLAAYEFTAAQAGEITAYFAGSTEAYVQNIGLMINGVATGITGLVNEKSSYGDWLVLGKAEAGDSLVFFTEVFKTGDIYYSQAKLNRDAESHVWSARFAGDKYIPTGTYVAFDDMRGSGDSKYHDQAFVLTNVAVVPAAVPEPGSWSMMITGFAVLGVARRRRRTTAD